LPAPGAVVEFETDMPTVPRKRLLWTPVGASQPPFDHVGDYRV
jgi:hypothetical protein